MLTEFLVNDVIGHKTLGMGSPYVDGFYIDDEVRCRLPRLDATRFASCRDTSLMQQLGWPLHACHSSGMLQVRQKRTLRL